MKKLVLGLAAALLVVTAASADEFSFSNEVSSGIVNIITDNNAGTTDVQFAGIADNAKAEFITDKFDVGVDSTIYLRKGLTGLELSDFVLNDWYIEFRPVSKLTIGFHDVIETSGSKLFVSDKNLLNGNIGSDVVVVFRPIVGLRIAGGFDVNSLFGDDTLNPFMNFGVDYNYKDLFIIGVSARDVANSIGVGVFASIKPVSGLTVNLGYSYNEYNDFIGNFSHDLMLSSKYSKNGFSIAGDLEVGIDALINTGINVDYDFTKSVNAGLKVTYMNLMATSENLIEINPNVTFTSGKHSFGLGLDCLIDNPYVLVTFPVSYKYSF